MSYRNPNLGVFITIAITFAIVAFLVIYLIRDYAKNNPKPVNEPEIETTTNGTNTEEEQIESVDLYAFLPKYEEVVTPKKTKEFSYLESGKYENLKIIVKKDLVFDGTVESDNVYIELANHSLIFEKNSEVVFKKSVIAHSPAFDKNSGLIVKSKKFNFSESAIIESLGFGIYFDKAGSVNISKSQFFDNRLSAIFVKEARDISITENKFINNGCTDPFYGRRRQYCIKDNQKYRNIEIDVISGNFTYNNNEMTGYLFSDDDDIVVNINNNKFLFKSGIEIVANKVTGLIESNIIKNGSMVLDIKNALGLRIDQNEIGETLTCKSSESILHNWADVLGLNYVAGKEISGYCSKLE